MKPPTYPPSHGDGTVQRARSPHPDPTGFALSRRVRGATAFSLLLLLTGCVSSSDIEKIQSQISDLQEQVAQLKRTASSKEEVQNVNTRIAEQTQTLLKSNATLVAKVDQIEEKMNDSQGTIEQTNYRVDRLVQQLTQAQHDIEELKVSAPRAPAPASGGGAPMTEVTVAPPAAGEDPMKIYQAAYRDYQKGNFDLAISGFREFLERSPASDLADNATYWIGESLFSQKKYRDAVEQFDSVVNKYPKSDKVPGALLKKGYSYFSLGEKAQGIVQLQYVIHEHPSSPEASLAKQKLRQLGIETK